MRWHRDSVGWKSVITIPIWESLSNFPATLLFVATDLQLWGDFLWGPTKHTKGCSWRVPEELDTNWFADVKNGELKISARLLKNKEFHCCFLFVGTCKCGGPRMRARTPENPDEPDSGRRQSREKPGLSYTRQFLPVNFVWLNLLLAQCEEYRDYKFCILLLEKIIRQPLWEKIIRQP